MKNQNPLIFKESYKRKLPHIQPKDAIFFITYRLNFTYPQDLINELNKKSDEFENTLDQIPKDEKKNKIEEFNKNLFDFEDNFLFKIQSHSNCNNDKMRITNPRSMYLGKKWSKDL